MSTRATPGEFDIVRYQDVVQELFACGLVLEAMAARSNMTGKECIHRAVALLDDAIVQVRNAALHTQRSHIAGPAALNPCNAHDR
ncbi:MAG: hypothetical protein AB7W59_09650 [Acidimicrobiia bacterium]